MLFHMLISIGSLTAGSGFVFPGDEKKEPIPSTEEDVDPKIEQERDYEKPSCSEEETTWCNPMNYPDDRIINLINKSDNSIVNLLDTDDEIDSFSGGGRPKVQALNVTENVCKVTTDLIYPKAARDKNGNFKFIVNRPEGSTKFVQVVQVSLCENAGSDCADGRLVGVLGSTECQQEYSEHKLVALNDSGEELIVDNFKFPSCCTCAIHSGIELRRTKFK